MGRRRPPFRALNVRAVSIPGSRETRGLPFSAREVHSDRLDVCPCESGGKFAPAGEVG